MWYIFLTFGSFEWWENIVSCISVWVFGFGLPRGWKSWNFGKHVRCAVLWDGGRDIAIYEFSSIETLLGGVWMQGKFCSGPTR